MIDPLRYRGRFAPSPTGPLHFGSAVAAFGSWLRARQADGTWLVRIEDLDPPREVRGASGSQLRSLQRLGLESDETVVRQSARHELYRDALERLWSKRLAFECRCSRSDLAAQGGVHRDCVTIASGRAEAIRARVPCSTVQFIDAVQGKVVQQLDRDVGDFVLRRVDGLFAYQLAVVVDDHLQGITEVVRGMDLLLSTPRQIWLQHKLGYATPAYVHLPLVLDNEGRKLGKSLGSRPLDEEEPAAILRAAWVHLGQPESALSGCGSLALLLATATAAFDMARVPRGVFLPSGLPTGQPV